MSTAGSKREFTGWHMLAIMVAFFSVIIAVNLTMAFFARSSWSGMVVENTYVASRQFNQKAAESRAQTALGWKADLTIADGKLSYRLIDGDGNPIAARQATAQLRRPANAADDHQVTLTRQADGSFTAPVALRDGLWVVEVDTEAGLARPYRDARRLTLQNGAAR